MKTRRIIGQRIVAVEQERTWDSRTSTWDFELKAIVLANGCRIAFNVTETEDVPYTTGILYVPRKGSKP